MTGISLWAVIGLILITVAVLAWVAITARANRNPSISTKRGGHPKRGDVSGGVIHGTQGHHGQRDRRDQARSD